MVPKVFEPFKFDCIYEDHRLVVELDQIIFISLVLQILYFHAVIINGSFYDAGVNVCKFLAILMKSNNLDELSVSYFGIS